ncbi:cysteine desulfurase family protein [Alkalihalobacillus pseudalcaliphilus]|uniref:cysteine desulfurase family protein n=1 Tax=Alkalihalobacillus pseudalcaliphilus TaxID=79884 RepID=UPI00064D9A32|nr:cysteine desulfurase family protein [Alkalihalobacillus pseudalcaliphilus]KMK74528.1 cysteine desulfurase [Alkalihalobacillus pseudalcaliphilus]
MIYFDNSATTKPLEEVVQTYLKVSTNYFGNPSSLHTLGMDSQILIEKARKQIAELLKIKPKEIIFTSGGTEGNNLAIKGTAQARRNRGKHLITTMVEHASSYEVFQSLEKEGFEVTYLNVNKEGHISVDELIEAIRQDTILISVIHVNNETGAIQPIEEISRRLVDYPHVRFHVDHVQGVHKVPLHFNDVRIDFCTMSAHKFHGLKGNGLLYVREGNRLSSLLHGGEQEFKLRAGTENVAGIVAMAKAFRLGSEHSRQGNQHLETLKTTFIAGIKKIDKVVIHTPVKGSAPHIVNFSIGHMKPEVLIQSLSKVGVYVSTKSACSSKLNEPSRILLAQGIDDKKASSAIRVSFSYLNTEDEVKRVLNDLETMIPELLQVQG